MRFTVNGVEHAIGSHPLTPLLHVLREEIGITSPKAGCQQGGCGACTVLVEGAPRRSCLVAAAAVDGAEITTLELLGRPEALSPILTAFHENYAAQCGFCTSGMVLAAHAYLENGGAADRESIQEALAGNLCRCTGYVKIVDAVRFAAAARRGEALPELDTSGRVGSRTARYQGVELALGDKPYINDMTADGLLHGAVRWSDHPRATVLRIVEMRQREVGAGRQTLDVALHDLQRSLRIRNVVDRGALDQRQRAVELDVLRDGGMVEHRVRLGEVAHHQMRAFVLLQQCPTVHGHHRIVVDVDDLRLGIHPLRDLVGVLGRGQPCADVDELVDLCRVCEESHRTNQPIPVDAADLDCLRGVLNDLLVHLAIDGVVVLAAEQVVVDPRSVSGPVVDVDVRNPVGHGGSIDVLRRYFKPPTRLSRKNHTERAVSGPLLRETLRSVVIQAKT
jgi:aerobic-type carbon monoxide dehydrogenase small subunit (CoxS/CutS family)